jgi:hypothetical protein
MASTQQPEEPSLRQEEIQSEVSRRLKRYQNLNVLEQFAMFMGVAQVVELSLKQLLHRRYAVEFESLADC